MPLGVPVPKLLATRGYGAEVVLEGEVDTDSEAEVLPRLVARVPGVVAVDSRLHVRGGVAG